MKPLVPPQLETALISFVKEHYLPTRYQKNRELPQFTRKDLEFFAPAVADLSWAFTAERSELPKNYFNKKEFRSAYLLYFFLTNFAKVMHCLRQIQLQGWKLEKKKLRILDVGSGPGTASLAASYFFREAYPELELEIIALEQNFEVARDGKNIFGKLAPAKHHLEIINDSLNEKRIPKNLTGEFDLIIAANVLNEFSVPQQTAVTVQLLERLNANGRLIIIDPALQKTTRQLMELRDVLLENQAASVLAPCLHQLACPMRANNKRDWCHFYIEWQCPKLIRSFDDLIGNKHDYLKMAYMVFEHPAVIPAQAGIQRVPLQARVVSAPLGSKGKTELLVCSSEGVLERLAELDRNREKKAQPFKGCIRGDIVRLPNLEKVSSFNK